MLPWSSLDILMLFPPYKRCKRSLRSKVNVIILSVGVLAVGKLFNLSTKLFSGSLKYVFRGSYAVLCLWILQLQHARLAVLLEPVTDYL